MVSNIQHSSILKNLWHFQSLICHSDTGSQNWHLICGSACVCVSLCVCLLHGQNPCTAPYWNRTLNYASCAAVFSITSSSQSSPTSACHLPPPSSLSPDTQGQSHAHISVSLTPGLAALGDWGSWGGTSRWTVTALYKGSFYWIVKPCLHPSSMMTSIFTVNLSSLRLDSSCHFYNREHRCKWAYSCAAGDAVGPVVCPSCSAHLIPATHTFLPRNPAPWCCAVYSSEGRSKGNRAPYGICCSCAFVYRRSGCGVV